MHAVVWFVWALGAMAVALGTRNPLYLIALLLIVTVVRERVADGQNRGISLVRFAAFALPISAAFNALSVHFGDTVLFIIPGQIPIISGSVTLEAAVYGAINGLMLTAVLAVFSTLNLAISPHEWMRFAPRSYQAAGMTMSIALSLTPQVTKRMRDVREAQAIRGHQVRGLRDWLPLWMPLLTGGLEQSMQLSEAMVARGFGATQAPSSTWRQLLLAAGLLLLMAGVVARVWSSTLDVAGVVLIALGVGAIVAAVWRAANTSPRTSLRDQRLRRKDIGVLALLLMGLACVFGPVLMGSAATLAYTPYPVLTLPPFDVLTGAALLVFVAPALVTGHSLLVMSR